MLLSLLTALADGQSRSLGELCRALEADPRSIRLAVDHCRLLGYLESADSGMGGGACAPAACGRCPVARRCGIVPVVDRFQVDPLRPTWLRLTDRGARAARAVGQARLADGDRPSA